MAWYDVYDNVEVQRITRNQAASTTAIVAALMAVSIAALALGIHGPVPAWTALAAAALTWGSFGYWSIRRRARLRRIVWCVKLSEDEVVGYDYSRRRITIAWRDVERLDVGDGSLTIMGPHAEYLEITHLFPEFPQVSHRVMFYAGRHDAAVYVDGRPWQQIDVYRLFPFILEDASSTQRGSTAV
jgi:hypothetical protein